MVIEVRTSMKEKGGKTEPEKSSINEDAKKNIGLFNLYITNHLIVCGIEDKTIVLSAEEAADVVDKWITV